MRRFAIDVLVAVPAVFVACILWNVALDAGLICVMLNSQRS
jgi:hypothetical protein